MAKDKKGIFFSFKIPKQHKNRMIKILGIVVQGVKRDEERVISWAMDSLEGSG